jgi:hypothetical protein
MIFFNLFRKKKSLSLNLAKKKANKIASLIAEKSYYQREIISINYENLYGRPIERDRLDTALLEIVIFYMAVTDRVSFYHLDSNSRETLGNFLFESVFNYLWVREWDTKLNNSLRKLDKKNPIPDFQHLYNKRQFEYSQYREMLPGGKDLGGTLLYEFSCNLADVIGAKSDPQMIIAISDISIKILLGLDLSRCLK